jgi:hypothetical protein
LEDGGKLGIGQPIVHRDIGNAGQRGGEEPNRYGLGVQVNGHESLGVPVTQVTGCGQRSISQSFIGEAPVLGAYGHPIRERVRNDLKERCQVHCVSFNLMKGAAWHP